MSTSSLSQADFRAALHDALRVRGLGLLEQYLDEVQAEGDIDDKRKAVELLIKTLNVAIEPDQKSLPTVTINFVGGSMQIAAKPAEPTDDPPLVEEVQTPTPDAPTEPPAALAAPEPDPLDGTDFLALLNNLDLKD